MKKILLSILTIGLVAIVAIGATRAYFSDTETSIGNTFTAGTLDLNIDGGNTNVVKFNVGNFRPGNQPIGIWTLRNVGTINGYLDLENIVITSYENICLDPETGAGDVTCGNPGSGLGELQNLVGMDLFWDYDCNGWYGAGEKRIYSSSGNPAGNVASSYDENEPLNAGSSVCVAAQFNWWSNRYGNDNLGQSDSMVLDITFELGQTAGQ